MIFLGLIEFYWDLPSFTGFHWVLLGFVGVLLGFTGFWYVFKRFYWVLLFFKGFYWVLLGFLGCYRVLPSFFFLATGFLFFYFFLPPATFDERRSSRMRHVSAPRRPNNEKDTRKIPAEVIKRHEGQLSGFHHHRLARLPARRTTRQQTTRKKEQTFFFFFVDLRKIYPTQWDNGTILNKKIAKKNYSANEGTASKWQLGRASCVVDVVFFDRHFTSPSSSSPIAFFFLLRIIFS